MDRKEILRAFSRAEKNLSLVSSKVARIELLKQKHGDLVDELRKMTVKLESTPILGHQDIGRAKNLVQKTNNFISDLSPNARRIVALHESK